MSTTTYDLGTDAGKKQRRSINWGHPITYFIALLFIAVSLAPVLFIVIGGFRTNSQITTDPAGLPGPWELGNYADVLTNGTFFFPGPTEVREEVLRAMTQPMIAHRGAAFEEMFARMQTSLQHVFGTTRPVYVSSSSATGRWPGGLRRTRRGAGAHRGRADRDGDHA